MAETRALSEQLSLRGRLDRVDRSARGRGIIDYKTGAAPDLDVVQRGEAVQLPSYALLLEDVLRVEYLTMDAQRVASIAGLEGEVLERLKRDIHQRLVNVWQAAREGSPLPAWGDPATCERCDMDGVCRREAWSRQPY